MMNLRPVEHNNQRVLLTQQLAEAYETSTDNIKMNFKNNKARFVEGVHYYLLKGAELRGFKNLVKDVYPVDKRAPQLYLWTEKGASRLCKIIGTDKAWDQFDVLEETYFRVKEQIATQFKLPNTFPEALRMLAEEVERSEKLKEENRVLAPKATYTDKVLLAEECYTVTSIAKEYGLSAHTFNKILNEYGIQYKVGGQWVLYAKYDDKGYTKADTQYHEDSHGVSHAITYTKWTQEGRHFLYQELKEHGMLPLNERGA